jgi:hypothetical protein
MVIDVCGVGGEHAVTSHNGAFVREPVMHTCRGIGGGMATNLVHVLLEHSSAVSYRGACAAGRAKRVSALYAFVEEGALRKEVTVRVDLLGGSPSKA